jgi:hypothetical protein
MHLFKRVKFACVEGDIKKYKGIGTDYSSHPERTHQKMNFFI